MADRVPVVDGFTFRISKEAFLDNSNFTKEETLQNPELRVRFISSSGNSNYYKIKSFKKEANDIYKIDVKESFKSDISVLFADTDAENLTYNDSLTTNGMLGDDSLEIELSRVVTKNKPEFTGRFFVKLERDFVLEK